MLESRPLFINCPLCSCIQHSTFRYVLIPFDQLPYKRSVRFGLPDLLMLDSCLLFINCLLCSCLRDSTFRYVLSPFDQLPYFAYIIICFFLHYNTFEANDYHGLFVTTGTYFAYIIILVAQVLGQLDQEPELRV
uniref:Uncharacterized protein n=1 Tax=Cacopsylla melanoneura TaxID=428564 RepID=A0A8D8LWH3_9HEMI